MKYVAIMEETTIHRIEFECDGDAEEEAIRGWKSGEYCDSDPYLDSLRVLEIREDE